MFKTFQFTLRMAKSRIIFRALNTVLALLLGMESRCKIWTRLKTQVSQTMREVLVIPIYVTALEALKREVCMYV